MPLSPPTAPRRPSAERRQAPAALDALIAVIRGLLIEHGVRYIAPPVGVLDEEEEFDVTIDLALVPNQLLPVFVQQARLVFAEAGFDRGASAPFPFDLAKDVGGLVALRVVEVPTSVPFSVAAACAADALLTFLERSPVEGGVLRLV